MSNSNIPFSYSPGEMAFAADVKALAVAGNTNIPSNIEEIKTGVKTAYTLGLPAAQRSLGNSNLINAPSIQPKGKPQGLIWVINEMTKTGLSQITGTQRDNFGNVYTSYSPVSYGVATEIPSTINQTLITKRESKPNQRAKSLRYLSIYNR